jgi:ABC-type uncharacterized transport system ATPase subunit
MSSPGPAVEFVGVHKWFGDCISASGLDFKIAAGHIHAIVGENGAGKSTAMKMLFGFYPPNQGTLKVHGREVHFHSPTDAMDLGIGMVHQHFMLADSLTALDNILLFQKNTRAFQPLSRAEHRDRLQKLAATYQFQIDWDQPVYKLSVGTQQRIEILKILAQDSKIIILDEPTAVLTPQETEDLFRNLRKLKAEGRTIIIITHKLKEVMAVADAVTVLRAGKVVATPQIHETSMAALAESMVGRQIKNLNLRERLRHPEEKIILKMTGLRVHEKHGALNGLNLQVRAGEILGVAGVEGNGQDQLIQGLLNPQSLRAQGHIEFKSTETIHLSAAKIRALGLAAFPEDRLRFGVLGERPAFENFILGYHRSAEYSRRGFLRLKNIFANTRAAMEKFDVRPREIQKTLGKMSGGNQQKLVVARELQKNPDFILAAKPTRGVDIGAIEFIHEQLLAARQRGAGILLVSSELEELMTLSDRIVVLYKGQIVAEFSREQGFDEITLGAAMGGHT